MSPFSFPLLMSILGVTLSPALPAILSSEALPPTNPRSTYFSVLFYTRKPPSHPNPYAKPKIYCAGALVAQRWVITVASCDVKLSWRILLGLRAVPTSAFHLTKNYGIKRIIDSLESLMRLVEMREYLKDADTKIPSIRSFSTEKGCIVSSWMSSRFQEPRKQETITKKLHCRFKCKNRNFCSEETINNTFVNLTQTDICLLQQKPEDPVSLCKFDIGAPLVCNGALVGLVYFITNIDSTESGNCYQNLTGAFYPAAAVYSERDWINFFIAPRFSSSFSYCLNIYLFIISLVFVFSSIY